LVAPDLTGRVGRRRAEEQYRHGRNDPMTHAIPPAQLVVCGRDYAAAQPCCRRTSFDAGAAFDPIRRSGRDQRRSFRVSRTAPRVIRGR
jgi:hypothetical protein